MNIGQLQLKLHNYEQALTRLEEAVNETNVNQYVYDSAVKRFEFVYELAWRLMKAFIEYKGGAEPKFPRDVFREAFAGGIISDGDIWLEMMKDRNLTSHTYDDEHAHEVYSRVKALYIVQYQTMRDYIKGELQNVFDA